MAKLDTDRPADMPSPEATAAFSKWREGRSEQQPRLGVSFANLSCHGVLSSTRSQTTLASYVLSGPRFILDTILSRRPQKVKVQILSDVNGLAQRGEMLLVLGRPGSGCSTLLKTLAGDSHSFQVGAGSTINYEGESHFDGFQPCLPLFLTPTF
jgi:ATP-binding cassette, subfamily G (WHITE), member 2, PDR